jgi:hypothetical protein
VNVVVSGWDGDTTSPGTYTIYYDATDSAGNKAVQQSRTVTVSDKTGPVITLGGSNPATVNEDTGTYGDLNNASAVDNVDAIVSVVVTGWNGDTSEPGQYMIYYNAVDSAGNPAVQQVRTVTVVDNTAPVITLGGNNPDTVNEDTGTYSDLNNASAEDNVDSNVSVVVTGWDGDTTNPGTFTIYYDATDSAGNNAVQKSRTVTVLDATGPVITANDRAERVDYINELAPVFGYVDYASGVSAVDAVNGPVTVTCSRTDEGTNNEFGFSDTPYVISCTATDSSNNTSTKTFKLTVQYLYDTLLVLPKGRARAGSTVPLDWYYLYPDGPDKGTPIDDVSAADIDVRVSWARMTNDTCQIAYPASTDGTTSRLDGDSGNSDFRYSAADHIWQFSWQTPNTTGWHKVAVAPPGGNVDGAWGCINLK